MDKLTHEQIDRLENKLDLLLSVYYEQDEEGNLTRKGQEKKEKSKQAEV